MKKTRKRMIFLAMAAMLAVPLSLSGCGREPANPAGTAADLMSRITARTNTGAPLSQEVSEKYQTAAADFSLDLFRRAYQPGQNSLISPMSAGIALGMTSNGANGNTEAQFLNLLAGELTQEQLNQAYSKQIAGLSQGERGILNLANSIWFRKKEECAVKEDFLQTNADAYQADVYQLDLSDNKTLSSINEWISSKTNGKIQKLLEEPIDTDTMMCLINTMYFEMDWETPFQGYVTRKGEFETATGKKVQADFMNASDGAYYIEAGGVKGIKKPYAGGQYSFMALMPWYGNETTDSTRTLDKFVSILSGETFLILSRQTEESPFPFEDVIGISYEEYMKAVRANPPSRTVTYSLPKFCYSYGTSLKNTLKAMGLTDAFNENADFTGISEDALGTGLHIGDILQKTFIEVDELGTKTGSATSVEIEDTGIEERTSYKITFDQPFLYAIVENETGLPLLIGTVMDPTAETAAGASAETDLLKDVDGSWDIPFVAYDSTGKKLQVESIMEQWNENILHSTGYRHEWDIKFLYGGSADKVADGSTVRFNFWKYPPAQVTVKRDAEKTKPEFLSGKEKPKQTEVPCKANGDGTYEFEVSLEQDQPVYYIMSAKWDETKKIDYTIAVQADGMATAE